MLALRCSFSSAVLPHEESEFEGSGFYTGTRQDDWLHHEATSYLELLYGRTIPHHDCFPACSLHPVECSKACRMSFGSDENI